MHKTRWITAFERGLARLVAVLVVLAGTVMVASLLIGVFFRYVVQSSLSWTDEVAMLSLSWTVFLSAVLLVRDNGHVRVEIIEQMLPAGVFRLLQRLIWSGIAALGAWMVWTGWGFVEITMGQTSSAIRYPLWLRNLSMPVSSALIALYALGHVFGLLRTNSRFETSI